MAIADEPSRPVALVQGSHGTELAVVDQELLGPQYEIMRSGKTVAVVKKQLFSLFHARFFVDVPVALNRRKSRFISHPLSIATVRAAPRRPSCIACQYRF